MATLAAFVSMAVGTLALHGYREIVVLTAVQAAVFGVLCAFTWLVTRGRRFVPQRADRNSWLQVVACLLSVALSGFAAAVGNGMFHHWSRPVAISAHAWTRASANPSYLHMVGSGVAQFVIYVLLTILLLLPFRPPLKSLYLQLSWRISTPVGIIWIAPEIALLIYGLTNQAYSLSALSIDLARNIFQNGFSEEFLFRGALLTRLANVLPVSWALVAQALLFGFWHYGADMRQSQGDLRLAFGFMGAQMLFGGPIR